MRKQKFISTTLIIATLVLCPQMSCAHDFGLADVNGKVLLPPIYEGLIPVSETCFRVTPKGNPKTVVPFFVNQNGETIPTPPGVELYDVEGPLAPPPIVPRSKGAQMTYPKLEDVKLPGANMREALGFGYYLFEKGSAFGVCDQHGKILFPPRADGSGEVRPLWTDRFLQDTYDVNSQRLYKLYDENAKLIATLSPGIIVRGREFHDDLLLVETDQERLAGYINRNGEYQIRPGRFFDGQDFNEGYANVGIMDHGTSGGGIIDTRGKIVAGPFIGGWIEHFENGLAKVTTSNKLTGMVDHSGAFVIPPEFNELYRKQNYIVGLKDGQLHVFSKKGSLETKLDRSITFIDPTGDGAWIFGIKSTSTAGHHPKDATPKTKYGVMTLSGKVFLAADYDHIGGFHNGYAVVGTRQLGSGDIKHGLLGPNHKFVIPQQYDGMGLHGSNVILFNSTKGFDKYAWLPSRKGRIERHDLWHQFLKEYDVIGMKRDSLDQLLGSGELFEGEAKSANSKVVTYLMSVSLIPHCGNSPNANLQIEFDGKNSVSGWRLHSDPANEPWVRTNMVYVKQSDGYRLIPKSAAKSYE